MNKIIRKLPLDNFYSCHKERFFSFANLFLDRFLYFILAKYVKISKVSKVIIDKCFDIAGKYHEIL